ncbi:MAG: HDOD domain-containing protein [Gammaproteobacteria bacterium]|nr:HDOD domain-containing protein [Gammaproteobacteria bacterium]
MANDVAVPTLRPPPPAADIVPGYRVRRLIGRGGMANVYLAVQLSLQRPVALKVMNPGYAADEALSQRFMREGRMLAALNHRNIITIHDIGVAGDLHYLSMEYVDGGDLRQRITGGIVPARALAYTEALASGLACIHARGIVHRDVKPANVLFRSDGIPALADFGIAKDLTRDHGATVAGAVIGSLAYLSPEQAEGAPLGVCSDIFSLGVVLFEMLAGRRSHTSGSNQISLAAIIRQLREPLPRLPPHLAAVQPLLDRMTAPDPRQRYGDCAEVVDAIRRLRRRDCGARRTAYSVTAAAAREQTGESYAVTEIRADDEHADNQLLCAVYHDYMANRLRVPSMPDIAARIRRAVDDPAMGPNEIARIVQADPALAAYLVRVANSAVYRGDREVQGAAAAVARIGLRATRDVVTSFTLRNVFTSRHRAIGLRMRALWKHSCVVGAVSAVLARHVPHIGADQALLAGIVYGIGRTVILRYAEYYAGLAADAAALDVALERMHAQVGAMVMRKWDMPEAFVTVALESQSWSRDPGPAVDLCDIVLLAGLFSHHGKPHAPGLPPIETVPAYRKLTASDVAPDFNVSVLHDARRELDELTRVLHG